MQRHNDVKQVWHSLCAHATQPSAVRDEPLIHTGRDNTAPGAPAAAPLPELRGDVAVKNFWRQGTECIFDVRVCDTECSSAAYRRSKKVLERAEKEKKDKYSQACLDRRRHFTPLVFSVDGLAGKEADAALKCLSTKLAKKRSKEYSQVVGFVRSRISISLVRSVSQCLRAPRDPAPRWTQPSWDSGEMGLPLYL